MILNPALSEMNESEEDKNDGDSSWTLEVVEEEKPKFKDGPFFMNAECIPEWPGHEHCAHLAECREYFIIARKDLMRETKWRRSKSVLWTIFALGIALGFILGGTLICIVHMTTDRRFIIKARKTRCTRQHIEDAPFVITASEEPEIERVIVNNVNSTRHAPTNQTQQRQRQHNQHQQPRRRVRRESFLTRLFQRQRTYPQRLIRRLSRSNLFNSTFRLNQSNARNLERQNSRLQNNRAHCDERRLLESHDSITINRGDRIGDASFEPPRSETPPPKYGDVVN